MFNKSDNIFDELKEKFDKPFNVEKTEEALDNIIILNDEQGNEAPFEFLDLITYKDDEYVVLLPVEECDVAGEVVILKLVETDNDVEESYVSVDDEDTLMAVFNIFKNKFKDEFNFVD